MNRHPLPAPPLPPGRPNLIVTGFMGTGKTSAGRAAAQRLGLPFVDLDEAIALRAGMPVAEIFAGRGEAAFRSMERAAVLEAARLSGAVIATGGGAPLDAASFAALAATGPAVVLHADPDELDRRLGEATGRPLLAGDPGGPGTRTRTLLDERAGAYAAAGEELRTTGRTVDEVAAALAARWRAAAGPGPGRVLVRGPRGDYPVLVGDGALAAVPGAVAGALAGARLALVVADGAVVDTHARGVEAGLAAAGLRVERVALPAGEPAKTLASLAVLWERLLGLGAGRADAVVGVGGGAALDTAGFAAATFARGMALVNVPTTLLAMADASVGGKVAIDHGGAKNVVGAFHHPSLVVADPATLASLPPAAVRHGLAEIAKAALIASPLLADLLAALPRDARGLPSHLGWLAEQSIRVKSAYVGADADDRGLRHSLNLGHTFAHAIESATDYAVPHGDAVAMGLVAAARLAERFGAAATGQAARVERLLAHLGLPTAPPAGLSLERVRSAMGSDKKRRGGRAVFVVAAAGGAELLDGLDPEDAIAALTGSPAPGDTAGDGGSPVEAVPR